MASHVSEEVWKPIPGLKGKYEASSHGQVRRILPFAKWNDYLTVHINRDVLLVHRLICAAFVGDPSGLVVNHKSAIKTDNRPENLEPVTSRENSIHAALLGLMPVGEKNGFSKITPEVAQAIRESKESSTVLIERYGISRNQICRILRGQAWKHIAGPPQDRSDRAHRHTFNGKTQTLKQWATELKTTRGILTNRLHKGWDIARTLTQPIPRIKSRAKLSDADKLQIAHSSETAAKLAAQFGGSRSHIYRIKAAQRATPRATHITTRKLSDADILQIVRSSKTQAELAAQFGVHQAQISKIRAGKRWGGLTGISRVRC